MTVTYTPQIWDVRAADAGSLSVLPRLGLDDWPQLKAFMQTHWPAFNIIGTHGEQRARDGERWWGIGAIEVKEGPQLFQLQFRQAPPPEPPSYDTGNIISFQWYPGTPDLDPRFDVRYYENGNFSFSEGSGDQGWPFGSDSGPFSFWVNSDPTDWEDRRVGSDALVNVHWWDNHVACNPVFWPMRKGGTTPPTTDAYLGVYQGGELLYYVPLVSGQPPTGFSGLAYQGPEGQWIWHVEGVKGMPPE